MTHRHKPERACQQGKDGWTQDKEGEYESDSKRTLPWRHASSSMELPDSPPDCKELTGTTPTAHWEKEGHSAKNGKGDESKRPRKCADGWEAVHWAPGKHSV